MKNYEVDVKAFINITVQADSKAEARKIADELVSGNFSPSPDLIEQLSKDLGFEIKTNGFDVDGTSDVELVDPDTIE